MTTFVRDFVGYNGKPPAANWPDHARVAVSLVINFEEGAELSISDGDERNESVYEVTEEVKNVPDPCMMSHFEYGTRAGYWRIMDILEKYNVNATISACGRAAERSPELIRDAVTRGHEIACHGYRWETHSAMNENEERDIIERTYTTIAQTAGIAPVGWHTRSASTPNTRRLLREHGGFLYDSDAYCDDLPLISKREPAPHVILPYSFDTNDMRFTANGGFVFADDFAHYCTDAFDRLWAEGATAPKMMSVGLHLRIIGRPARIAGLEQFLEHVTQKGGAWFARRDEIAHHWRQNMAMDPWAPQAQAV